MNNVTKPTLLINKKIAISNIKRMVAKANNSHVIFRPHFKTHLSKEIGEWYRNEGVDCITVSSIDMAVYFASHGWDDITIAFPVNILQIEVLKHLSKQVKLSLVVSSVETVKALNEEVKSAVSIFIKIDTGYHRAGIWHEDVEIVKSIAEQINDTHEFGGLLVHFGHTYKETEADKILDIYQQGVNDLNSLKDKLCLNPCQVSIGDTPSCSLVEEFENVDEIRPGNFVFYDVMQSQIGACTTEEIAVCLAVPVVEIHTGRSEVVVHGGAVHLSKEVLKGENGTAIYGQVVRLNARDWSSPLAGYVVKSLSQEHGIITVPREEIENIRIGDLLGILPVHSCLTANLMKEYQTLRGDKITTMHS